MGYVLMNLERIKKAFMACMRWCENTGKEVSPSPNSPHFYGKIFPDIWRELDGRFNKVTKKQFQQVYVRLLVSRELEEVSDPRNNVGKRLRIRKR